MVKVAMIEFVMRSYLPLAQTSVSLDLGRHTDSMSSCSNDFGEWISVEEDIFGIIFDISVNWIIALL